MKKYIVLFIIIITFLVTNAQTSHPVNIDSTVIRFEWVKRYGLSGLAEYDKSITIDSRGNIYTVGSYTGTVDFDPGPSVYNLNSNSSNAMYILKLDSLGQFLWVKSINCNNSNNLHSLDVDKYGNVYVTSNFSGTVDFDPGPLIYHLSTNSFGETFVLKLNSYGYFVWAKSFETDIKCFDKTLDCGTSISVDEADNIIITGLFNYHNDFDPGPNQFILNSLGGADAFIVKLSNLGELIWVKRFGGALSDIGYSVDTDYFGNIYVTGNFGGTIEFETLSGTNSIISNGMWDIFIVKLDPDGNFVWARNKGKKWRDNSRSIAVSPTGDVYIAGVLESEIIVWNKYTNSYTGIPDSPNMYIAEFDSIGNFLWENEIADSRNGNYYSISCDNIGNVYATGNFKDTLNLGTNSPIPELVSQNSISNMLFLIRFNTLGEITWVESIGKNGTANGQSIFIDKNNNIFVKGICSGAIDFDFGPGTTIQKNGSGFILKLSQSTISNNNIYKQDTTVQIHPDPTWNSIKIELPDTLSGNIELYNMVGEKVLEKDFTNQQIIDVNIEKLHDSEYVLKIYNTSVIIAIKKIIKN